LVLVFSRYDCDHWSIVLILISNIKSNCSSALNPLFLFLLLFTCLRRSFRPFLTVAFGVMLSRSSSIFIFKTAFFCSVLFDSHKPFFFFLLVSLVENIRTNNNNPATSLLLLWLFSHLFVVVVFVKRTRASSAF